MHLERIWNAYEKNKKGKLRPAHRGFAAGIAIDIARKDCAPMRCGAQLVADRAKVFNFYTVTISSCVLPERQRGFAEYRA